MGVNYAGPVICRFFRHIGYIFVYLWTVWKNLQVNCWLCNIKTIKKRYVMAYNISGYQSVLSFWGDHLLHLFTFFNWNITKIKKNFFGFPDGLVGKESTCNEETLGSIPGLGRSAWKGIGYPFQYSWASLVAQLIKNLPAIYDLGSIRRLGRSPGEGNGCPLQYSGLENSMDLIVHGSHKESDTTDWLSLIEIYLIYNMLISAIQQSDSIYIYAFFF